MQDVNPAQFRLFTAMLADEPDLFVVGDPNQSVYGFKRRRPDAARPAAVDTCHGTAVIRLDENHRCTPQVVAVATAVLAGGWGVGAAARSCRPHDPGSTGPSQEGDSHD